MRIISIANQKGGCGKTTTAINLASSLGLIGKKTLLIDLDPQAHASLGLNFEDQDSIYNVISNITPRKLDIVNIIKPAGENLDIVPSNILVGTLEQELADEIGRELKLTETIAQVQDNYDYILIDCPPNLGFLTINALRASHEVIIPVETSRFSMQGVDHLMDIISLIKDRLNHPVAYKVLITMFDSRLRHSFSMLSQIREKFADCLIDTIIHTNVKLKESVVLGQTVSSYDKYCRGAKDYMSLGRELVAADKIAVETPSPAAATAPTAAEKEASAPQEPEEETAPEPAKEEPTEVESLVAESGAEEEQPAQDDLVVASVELGDDPPPTPDFQPLSEKMQAMVKEESKELLWTSFCLTAPEAQSVYVTGSFNDWSLDESCRMRFDEAKGQWIVDVALKPGVYKYQFIVDGRWREDPANPRQERNSFGDINSIIEVTINGQGDS